MYAWVFIDSIVKPILVVEEDCFPRFSRCIGEDHEVLVLLEEEYHPMFVAFNDLKGRAVYDKGIVSNQDEISMEVIGPC